MTRVASLLFRVAARLDDLMAAAARKNDARITDRLILGSIHFVRHHSTATELDQTVTALMELLDEEHRQIAALGDVEGD